MNANDQYQIKQHEAFMKENRKQKALDAAIQISHGTLSAFGVVKEAGIIERYLAGSVGKTIKIKKKPK